MKRGRKVLFIIGVVLVVLVGLIAIGAFNGMSYVRRMTVNEVDMARVADGTYKGAFSKGRWRYNVEVSVKDHRIVSIALPDPKQASALTPKVIDAILQKQAVKIDAVSGASLTTKAFARAVENALEQAR
jgi:uncharacterized protein with FMN-binding domain